jgi:hypothetical protein
MRIPHTRLSAVVLRAVVEEFVTRDGTDHSAVERRIEAVLRQLDVGRVELHFDADTETVAARLAAQIAAVTPRRSASSSSHSTRAAATVVGGEPLAGRRHLPAVCSPEYAFSRRIDLHLERSSFRFLVQTKNLGCRIRAGSSSSRQVKTRARANLAMPGQAGQNVWRSPGNADDITV